MSYLFSVKYTCRSYMHTERTSDRIPKSTDRAGAFCAPVTQDLEASTQLHQPPKNTACSHLLCRDHIYQRYTHHSLHELDNSSHWTNPLAFTGGQTCIDTTVSRISSRNSAAERDWKYQSDFIHYPVILIGFLHSTQQRKKWVHFSPFCPSGPRTIPHQALSWWSMLQRFPIRTHVTCPTQNAISL